MRKKRRDKPAKDSPAWVRCETCDDFWCAYHGLHAYDCRCPAIDEWAAIGLDPYSDKHPGDDAFKNVSDDGE